MCKPIFVLIPCTCKKTVYKYVNVNSIMQYYKIDLSESPDHFAAKTRIQSENYSCICDSPREPDQIRMMIEEAIKKG